MFQRRRLVSKSGSGGFDVLAMPSSIQPAEVAVPTHPMHMATMMPLPLHSAANGSTRWRVLRIAVYALANILLIVVSSLALIDVLGYTTTAAGQAGTMSRGFAILQVLLLTPVAIGSYWLFYPPTGLQSAPLIQEKDTLPHEGSTSSYTSLDRMDTPPVISNGSLVGTSSISAIGAHSDGPNPTHSIKLGSSTRAKPPTKLLSCSNRGALYIKYGQPLMGPISAALLAVALAYGPAYVHRAQSITSAHRWAAGHTPPLSDDDYANLFYHFEGPVVASGDAHLHLFMCLCDVLVAVLLICKRVSYLGCSRVACSQPPVLAAQTGGQSPNGAYFTGHQGSVTKRQGAHPSSTGAAHLGALPYSVTVHSPESITTTPFSPFSMLTILPTGHSEQGAAAKGSALIRPDDKPALWEGDREMAAR